MSAESPRHMRSGGPLTVPSQPPSDRSIIDAVSGFINDVTLSSSSNVDPKDVIQWARFETADINEPTQEGDSDDLSPLLLILGYGSGVQVWLIPPTGEAQEVLSWRQGTVRVLRILPTPQHGDCYASKRPLIALCDSISPGPSYCSLSFISIRGGEQVKNIKFKNQILDVLANKRSVVVSFSERFAVFDAGSLEDRLTVTTCYPCPCPLGGASPINPLALGDRWIAYADKKLNPSKRSSGGCEGEGVTSYTATVLHAAKSLSKGLRGLGETVAQSLAGGRSTSQSPSPPNTDIQQPGVITILDIEGYEDDDMADGEEPCDPMVAHFIAHSEAIIALKFDASGMLLVTADRRGHDFHVFRVNPHPCGPSLASVHHLYILHRGDTTAKVQDIAISGDGRWAAVSTLRGTTHVFAVSPYGGACGVRTHTQPRVVNRLSRFQRSAGLPIHAPARHRSGSPVGDGMSQGAWFPNPRLPPYPMPVTSLPLAQLRPTANLPTHTITRTSSGRQRLSSVSEEGAVPLLARAWFGAGGAGAGGGGARAPAAAPLHLMAASGALLHLVLHPRPARNVPKEKISDESPIEVEVEAVAQWPLARPPSAADLLAPLPPSNPLLQQVTCRRCSDACLSEEERWLSQVEILTHAGPHRRLWMGPQFVFKTYTTMGSSSSLSEAETVEVEANAARSLARSNPVNMPGSRPLVPVIVDSGSASSLEHSPSDSYRRRSLLSETGRAASVSDVQLREDLAEAMKEDNGRPREGGEVRRAGVVRAVGPAGTVVAPPAPAVQLVSSHPPRDHALPNADEARFCAVRAAPCVSSAPGAGAEPGVTVRPLPRDTTLPVQRAPSQPPPAHPAPHPMPLQDAVVIPVALDNHPNPTDLSFDKFDLEKKPENEFVFDSHDVANLYDINVNKDLKCGENDDSVGESARECVSAKPVERVSSEAVVLPKSNRPSDDIQPTAAVRSKKSPTPKSVGHKNINEVSVKNAFSIDIEKPKKINKNKDDDLKIKIDKKYQNKETNVIVEPKIEIGAKDIVKIKREEINGAKDLKEKTDYQELTKEEVLVTKDVKKEEVKKNKQVKCKETKMRNEIDLIKETKVDYFDIKPPNIVEDKNIFHRTEQELCDIVTKDLANIEVQLPNKNAYAFEVIKPNYDIKTEEQAWDLLINEPEKMSANDKISDLKPKTRKNRRKIQDDATGKEDKDSFIEIHAIEDKQQSSSVLVSISTPFDDIEPLSYLPKSKKSRSPKSITPERKIDCESKQTECNYEKENEYIDISSKKYPADIEFSTLNVDIASETYSLQMSKSNQKSDKALKVIDSSENIIAAIDISPSSKPHPRSKKSKSTSPFLESRKTDRSFESDTKDVYVINTMEEDFPEIQITRANKARKKSPQPEHRHSEERESVYEKPVVSWSSIAASKSLKKAEETDIKAETTEVLKTDTEVKSEKRKFQEENPESSKKIMLQQKLFELCKRTDIMIAECDAPSELNFVEEHHAVMKDLPPLEPLDFGLDDFKLEVMRDSLLDVNDPKTASPICKINIDDILSSIKETTSKAIESSMFNLVDLEKVPGKKEKGFSVIDTHKIRTQEFKLDDESKSSEKSSDDEPSVVLSADSDKEEKKTIDPDKAAQPLSKQSSKSKKPRRKKK